MKKKISAAILIFIAIALLFSRLGNRFQAQSDNIRVTKVIDGDTIGLSNGESVRYIGIDTPEIREKHGTVWVYNPRPYAEEAKAFNKTLVEGKNIRLEFDVQKRDKYGRLLAYVYESNRMVNLEMLKEGYAMIYTYPPNVRYTEDFLNAQKLARINEKGLWKGLESNVISSAEARENIGKVRIVETQVHDTFLSDKLLALNCRDGFKVVVFRNNMEYFPKEILRSPQTYFKYKTIRVYGVIEDYKGSCEIVIHDASQVEIL